MTQPSTGSSKKTARNYDDIRQSYISWLYMDEMSRVAAKLPTSDQGFADSMGVSQATLYRWRHNKDFQKLQREYADQQRIRNDPRGVLNNAKDVVELKRLQSATGELNRDERILETMYERAELGDRTGLEFWAKGPGKTFLEQISEAQKIMFHELDDDQLQREELLYIQTQFLIDELEDRGFIVTSANAEERAERANKT